MKGAWQLDTDKPWSIPLYQYCSVTSFLRAYVIRVFGSIQCQALARFFCG
jgi:hypothetical protein